MGKILNIVVGLAVAVIGLYLLICWRKDFLFILKGCLPLIFIFGGTLACVAGIAELKDTLKHKI